MLKLVISFSQLCICLWPQYHKRMSLQFVRRKTTVSWYINISQLTVVTCYMLLVLNNVLKYTLSDNLYPFCQTIDHISFLSRYQPYHFCHTINFYIFSVNLSTISSQLLQQKMFCRSRWTITVQSIIVYLVNYPLLKDTFVVSFQFHHFTCSF